MVLNLLFPATVAAYW